MKNEIQGNWLRRLLALTVVGLMTACAFAARAKIEWKSYRQPDGTTLVLTLSGDEHFSCYRDRAGQMYERDSVGVFHLLSDVPHEPDDVPRDTPSFTRSDFSDMAYAPMDWDATRTYRQLVVLVTFSDCDFLLTDPRQTYDDIFNQPGYNQRLGAGCVADYFRDQSGGALNLAFDVYGPFKVSTKVQPSTSTALNEGKTVFREATRMLMAENPNLDYSPYDWNGDGRVNQVVYVYAGYSGNQAGINGYIWPTTGTFSSISTPDGHTIASYSASGELWLNNTSCGIGTICHEFSHSLGLPDIYPTSTSTGDISVVDEWDLMDGGHFTNRGWCPPNYSPLEKMLLGWLTPEELTADTVITGLRPVAEGGKAFLVRHTDEEFYLIENRQWKGWDYGLPGQGLVVYHVDYSINRWRGNTVNNVKGKPYYSIVAADNMTYNDWYDEIMRRGGHSPYADLQQRIRSAIMSTAPYPWETDSTGTVNRALTNTSLPSNEMYNEDEHGQKMLSKSITDIVQGEDGSVSFAFHTTGEGTGISAVTVTDRPGRAGVYTLQGRKVAASPASLPKGIYIVNGKKVVRR